MLKNYVLPGTNIQIFSLYFLISNIIRRIQNNCKTHIRIMLNLLYYSSPRTGFFVKNNSLKSHFLYKSCRLVFRTFIVPMNNKYSFQLRARHLFIRRVAFCKFFPIPNSTFNEVICDILGSPNCLVNIGWSTNYCN